MEVAASDSWTSPSSEKIIYAINATMSNIEYIFNAVPFGKIRIRLANQYLTNSIRFVVGGEHDGEMSIGLYHYKI